MAESALIEAIADASKAIELDPRNSYAFVERGVFEYSKKEYDKALARFSDRHRDGFPGRRDLYCPRDDLAEQARSEQGICRAQAGQEIDPRHPDAYAAIASMFMMQGKTDKALKVLDQAVAIDPQCADSHGNRAVVFLAMGKYDKALDDLDEVLRVAPNSARAQRERAWILATCPDAKVRNGEQAVLSATKACELTDWKEPHSLATLAAACSEAGDFDGAVKWQQKAIDLLPDKSPDKREYRGVARPLQGQEAISSSGIACKSWDFPIPIRRRSKAIRLRPSGVCTRKGIRSCRPSSSRLIIALVDGGRSLHDARGASDLPGGAKLTAVRPSQEIEQHAGSRLSNTCRNRPIFP